MLNDEARFGRVDVPTSRSESVGLEVGGEAPADSAVTSAGRSHLAQLAIDDFDVSVFAHVPHVLRRQQLFRRLDHGVVSSYRSSQARRQFPEYPSTQCETRPQPTRNRGEGTCAMAHSAPPISDSGSAGETDHLVITREGHVALVRINRPHVRNALNQALLADLVATLEALDADPDVRAIVLTGDERAFAAGADITEMAEATAAEMYLRPQQARWDRLRKIRKPLIAAVAGFALGGGNELAMLCDLIVAAESARFGQPEINLGIIPGAGGTQRLVRAIGKARAMEIVLTGRMMTADEAYAAGLITRVVPTELYLTEAMRLAQEIAVKPPLAVQLAKDAVLKAFDTTLETGLDYERRAFTLAFATEDRREGMAAFLEKRAPAFKGR
jgi:enoyl-CoA hydratase